MYQFVGAKKALLLFVVLLLTHFSFSQKKDSVQSEVDKMIAEATVNKYIIVAGSSIDFKTLDNLAKQISKSSGIVYQNELEYDKKRGMIEPDSSSDEIYAGSYIPRRYDENTISIEMLWYYTEKQNNPNNESKDMIILAGIFTELADAEKQLLLIKKVVPTAYVKKKAMYMGCMH